MTEVTKLGYPVGWKAVT